MLNTELSCFKSCKTACGKLSHAVSVLGITGSITCELNAVRYTSVLCLGACSEETGTAELRCCPYGVNGSLDVIKLYVDIISRIAVGTVPRKVEEKVGLLDTLFLSVGRKVRYIV